MDGGNSVKRQERFP